MKEYAEIIDILTSDTVDFKAMCIEIAKSDPKLFLSAVRGDAKWRAIFKSQGKIPAIKQYRESGRDIHGQTHIGLKEAKDYIESL
jgi:ribosomal protein L7/L12